MIITISGRAGSGKSTIAGLLAKTLKFAHYSTGDLMRNMAKERGISLIKLSKIAEQDKLIDKELDCRQIELGKKQDNFVIDGRLSGFFIPNSIKIFLDADEKERARRILNDAREEEGSDSIGGMIEEIQKREVSEIRRYKEHYSFNCYNKRFYEIVVNTTNKTPKEVVKKILEQIKE